MNAVQDAVVRRWGELGRRWDVGRTTAEVYALLHLCGRPRCADDVVSRLHVSRGVASVGLRSLCRAGVIRRVTISGDRRDFFEAAAGIGGVVGVAAARRQRRAVRPVLDATRQCRAMLDVAARGPAETLDPGIAVARERLMAVEEMMTVLDQLLQPLADAAPDALRNAAGDLASP